MLKYQANVRHCAVTLVNNADSVDVVMVAVSTKRSHGIVSHTILGPVEDHPFADQMCRVLVIQDVSLKLSSREEAEEEASQHYTLSMLENKPAALKWTNAVKCKAELENLLNAQPGSKKPSEDDIAKAQKAFSDAAVAANANCVKSLRLKLSDAGYVAYGVDSVARILQSDELEDAPDIREEEKKNILAGGVVISNYRIGNECLAEALSSFRSYLSESGVWHPAMTPWTPPRNMPTFAPIHSKSLQALQNEDVRIKRNAHGLNTPCDPRGPDAYAFDSNPTDCRSSDSS